MEAGYTYKNGVIIDLSSEDEDASLNEQDWFEQKWVQYQSYAKSAYEYLQKDKILTADQLSQLKDEKLACMRLMETMIKEAQLFGFGAPDWVYWRSSNFHRSNFSLIDKTMLQCVRYTLLIPSAMLIFNLAMANEPLWFFYYFTHWGVVISALSIIASIYAADVPQWQTTAMITTQCAIALNLTITLFFWTALAPYIFPNLSWDGHDLYMRVHMTALHSVPLLQIIINVLLTDMVPLKADYPMMVALGFFYMFANRLGKLDTDVPIYPVVDWTNPVLSFAGWTLNALVMSALYYIFAILVEKYREYIIGKKSE